MSNVTYLDGHISRSFSTGGRVAMTMMIGQGRRFADLFTGSVCFQQTVPRLLVHRAAVSEVFITDLQVADEQTSHIGAPWPRAHSFFGPKMRLHDPMLLAETIRQATPVGADPAAACAPGATG